MFNKKMLNLQLFAEGAAPAASTGQATGETTGDTQATAENIPGLPSTARRKTKVNPLANVKYGKQETEVNTSEPTEQNKDVDNQSASSKLSFDELIKGEYKADYTKAVENVVSQRLKKYKGLEAQMEKLQPILKLAGNQYGIDPSDEDFISKISSAINNDDHFYEKYALEKGCSVEEAKRVVSLEQHIAELDRKKEAREREEAFERSWDIVLKQAEATKQIFPQFDLEVQMQDERFARLLANGVDTTAAFIATNHKNIIPATVQMATEQAVQQTVNAVKANKARPVENGLSSQATAVIKDDPSKFTLADFKQIRDNFKKTGVRPKF